MTTARHLMEAPPDDQAIGGRILHWRAAFTLECRGTGWCICTEHEQFH